MCFNLNNLNFVKCERGGTFNNPTEIDSILTKCRTSTTTEISYVSTECLELNFQFQPPTIEEMITIGIDLSIPLPSETRGYLTSYSHGTETRGKHTLPPTFSTVKETMACGSGLNLSC